LFWLGVRVATTNPTFIKDPNASKDYPIDWSGFLAAGEGIASSQWIVPDGITVVPGSEDIDGAVTVASFSGGQNGVNYAITNRIVTDSTPPRSEDVSVLLLVRESSGEGSVALLTLPEFKGLLGPGQTALLGGTYDTFLIGAIESQSAEAERICDRKFRAANYLERVSYEPGGDLLLRQYPIIQVFSIHTSLEDSVLISNSAVNAVRASVRVDEDRSIEFRVVGGASHGVLTVDPTGYADNLNDLVASINGLGSGWSASLASGRSGYELLEDLMETVSISLRPGQTVSLPILGEPVDASWELDREAGAILRNVRIYDGSFLEDGEFFLLSYLSQALAAFGEQSCWVKYRAGYEEIPRDLQRIVAGHVTRQSQMESYNPFLSSEKIGAYSYNTASLSGVQSSSGSLATTIQQDFEKALSRWRRIAL
jgi:hypothetical protein